MATIILNKNNLYHNLEQILAKTKDKNKIAVVLKDNAYGHGILEVASMIKDFGITKVVVRTLDDALKIEKLFPYILILADTNIHTYSHTFHITINSLKDIEKLPKNTKIHLKIDSGMHRNGISPNELEEAIHGVLEREMKLCGVFTHFRSADVLSSEFYYQKEIFEEVKNKVKNICEKLFQPIPMFHSCNSSALFRCDKFDEDFARIGIATYGYIENQSPLEVPNLKPVLSLKANLISSRKLTSGDRVGYGGTYEAQDNMIVSTYDIGYGDGFLRINEKKKYFTPKGYELLGRVSMDNLSLNCDEEEVILFDNVEKLAKLHDTITYEILTSLKPHIKRQIR